MTRTNLLLADDSLPSLLVAKAMLEKLGYHVTTAENGDEALTLACESTFDIIMLDEHLPGKRGSDIAAYLRQHDTPNTVTTLISITGEHDPQERARILAAGIDALIDKPVSLAKLQATLQSSPAALDDQTIESLVSDLGKDTAKRLLNIFIQELADLSRRLREADDLVAEIHAVSHMLKNSAMLYGATELAALARDLNESSAVTDSNAPDEAARLITLCQTTTESVENTLQQEFMND